MTALRLFLFLLASVSSQAAEPFCQASPGRNPITVSASGNAKHRSIQQALNEAKPGDTILVKAGEYKGDLTFPNSGKKGACIRVVSESRCRSPQDRSCAVVKGGAHGFRLVGRSFIEISGFAVTGQTGGTPVGISVRGAASHVLIKENLVHGIHSGKDAHAIAVHGDTPKPITQLVVRGNEITGCRLGSSEALVVNGNVEGFQILENKVHNVDNIGIDIIGHEGTAPAAVDFARNGVVRGNLVYNVSSARNPAYKGERSAGGIYVDGGRDILIEGNTVRDSDIGIELASEHKGKSTSGVIVKGNKVSGSFQGNLMMGGYDSARGRSESLTVEGNHFSQAKGAAEIIIQHHTNGVAIRGNTLIALKKNIDVQGRGNTNILVEGNRYSLRPRGDDLARKDGQFQMLQER